MANEFIARNGLIAQNNSTITGSLIVTNGITGSLFGTASFSTNATSASFSTTSSFTTTSSFSVTSSYAITASFAQSVEFEGKPLSPGYPNNYIMPVKITSPAGNIANTPLNDATANIRYYPIVPLPEVAIANQYICPFFSVGLLADAIAISTNAVVVPIWLATP